MQSICKSSTRETQHRRNVRRDLGDHPAPPLISGEKGDSERDLLKVTQMSSLGLRQDQQRRASGSVSIVSNGHLSSGGLTRGRVARAWHGAQQLPGSLLLPWSLKVV